MIHKFVLIHSTCTEHSTMIWKFLLTKYLYLQNIFTWQNKDPLSFQPWKNFNLQKNKLHQKYYITFPNQCARFKKKNRNIIDAYVKDLFVKFCPWVKKVIDNHAINKYKYSDQVHTYVSYQSGRTRVDFY